MTRLLRRSAVTAARSLLYALYGHRPPAGVRVLEYHYIDDTGSPLSVSAQDFEFHLLLLKELGYRSLSPGEYLDRLQVQTPSNTGSREVFITFDDGEISFAEIAAPLLKRHGFTATVFVVTRMVGQTPAWFMRDRETIRSFLQSFAFTEAELAVMERAWAKFAANRLITADGLKQLISDGFFVECHTASHRFLSKLPAEDLAEELVPSRQWLKSELGVESRLLCYPYGDANDQVAKAAVDAGFQAAFLSEFSTSLADPFRLGRLPLGGRGNRSALKFGQSHAADVLYRSRQKFLKTTRN